MPYGSTQKTKAWIVQNAKGIRILVVAVVLLVASGAIFYGGYRYGQHRAPQPVSAAQAALERYREMSKNRKSFLGDLAKVDDNAIELKDISDESVTVKLDSNTVIIDQRGKEIERSSLKEGQRVTVSAELREGEYYAVRIRARSVSSESI